MEVESGEKGNKTVELRMMMSGWAQVFGSYCTSASERTLLMFTSICTSLLHVDNPGLYQ